MFARWRSCRVQLHCVSVSCFLLSCLASETILTACRCALGMDMARKMEGCEEQLDMMRNRGGVAGVYSRACGHEEGV